MAVFFGSEPTTADTITFSLNVAAVGYKWSGYRVVYVAPNYCVRSCRRGV